MAAKSLDLAEIREKLASVEQALEEGTEYLGMKGETLQKYFLMLTEQRTLLLVQEGAFQPAPQKLQQRRVDPMLDDRAVTWNEYVAAHKEEELDANQLHAHWQNLHPVQAAEANQAPAASSTTLSADAAVFMPSEAAPASSSSDFLVTSIKDVPAGPESGFLKLSRGEVILVIYTGSGATNDQGFFFGESLTTKGRGWFPKSAVDGEGLENGLPEAPPPPPGPPPRAGPPPPGSPPSSELQPRRSANPWADYSSDYKSDAVSSRQRGWSSSKNVSALRHAAMNNDYEAALRLLDWKTDVDVRAKDGKTPLFIAAGNGCYNVAELLLQRGADINAQHKYGLSVLDEAEYWLGKQMAQRNQEAADKLRTVIDLLRSYGAQRGQPEQWERSFAERRKRNLQEQCTAAGGLPPVMPWEEPLPLMLPAPVPEPPPGAPPGITPQLEDFFVEV